MHRFTRVAIGVLAALPFSRAEFNEGLLQGLDGVGLEVRPVHVRSARFALTEAMLRKRFAREMGERQISLLSGSEREAAPGQPYLELGVNIAHAQGPSHLYTVTLKLKEMAVLERTEASGIAVSLSTWERESLGIANRPEAVLQTLDRMIRIFSQAYHQANAGE